MNEYGLGLLSSLKLLLIVTFATLYWLGGRKFKTTRRILGGLIISLGVVLMSVLSHSFSLIYLLSIPAYIGALSLGYGADTEAEKLRKRLIYGLALGGSSLIFAVPSHHLGLGLFQVGLAVSSSMYLGVANPIKAVEEETLIATLSTVLVPFMI